MLEAGMRRLLGVGILGSLLVLAGCLQQSKSTTVDSEASRAEVPRTLRGSFDLYYTLQTGPTSTSGTGSAPEKISAIHFYETYIVVEGVDSGGRVLPIEKLSYFRWE